MKYLALCALLLCGCGDGRIVRALNSGPAYYPVTSSTSSDSDADYEAFKAKMAAWDQESQIEHVQTQLNDLQNYHPELF